MPLVIGVCIGFILGIIVALCVLRKDSVGNLVIADDPEEGTYMFLEIVKTDIRIIRSQSLIKLNVVDKGKIPLK